METYGYGRYYVTTGAIYRYTYKASAVWFARKLSRDWEESIRVYDSHSGDGPHKCVAAFLRGKRVQP